MHMFNKPLPWTNRSFNSSFQRVIKPSCSVRELNTVELPLVKVMEQSVVKIYHLILRYRSGRLPTK